MLSLMAGTLPAASNPRAFDIAVSNLIEVTQTRSAYGHVMNKRAASGCGGLALLLFWLAVWTAFMSLVYLHECVRVCVCVCALLRARASV